MAGRRGQSSGVAPDRGNGASGQHGIRRSRLHRNGEALPSQASENARRSAGEGRHQFTRGDGDLDLAERAHALSCRVAHTDRPVRVAPLDEPCSLSSQGSPLSASRGWSRWANVDHGADGADSNIPSTPASNRRRGTVSPCRTSWRSTHEDPYRPRRQRAYPRSLRRLGKRCRRLERRDAAPRHGVGVRAERERSHEHRSAQPHDGRRHFGHVLISSLGYCRT